MTTYIKYILLLVTSQKNKYNISKVFVTFNYVKRLIIREQNIQWKIHLYIKDIILIRW